MSAGFDVDVFDEKDGEITGRCSIVSIYEDLGARDLLLGICDSLAWTFQGDLEFKAEWWRFKYLADPEIGMEAAQKAAQADLILLASRSSELPTDVQKWFESWLPKRTSDDGALVFVQPASKSDPQSTLPLMTYLRLTAKRAHLDYLRLGSPVPTDGIAKFPIFQPGMNDLLSNEDRPQHWGINE